MTTRADWRGLLALAATCVGEAAAGDDAPVEAEADLRLSTLANRANAASSALFEREAGAATADAARAFLRVTKAFARRETPGTIRRALAPMVGEGATFLNDRLHALATDDFQRAHVGRPEVYG